MTDTWSDGGKKLKKKKISEDKFEYHNTYDPICASSFLKNYFPIFLIIIKKNPTIELRPGSTYCFCALLKALVYFIF